MDGVLCDFNKAYRKLDPDKSDRKKFREAVLEHKIFEDLDFMPDTQELLNYVCKLNDINIEILTSMGSTQTDQASAARAQKQKWLDKWNIPFRANFVHSKPKKAKFASDKSILIDDSVGCISPFRMAGGHGILHVSSKDTILTLDDLITQIYNDFKIT